MRPAIFSGGQVTQVTLDIDSDDPDFVLDAEFQFSSPDGLVLSGGVGSDALDGGPGTDILNGEFYAPDGYPYKEPVFNFGN